MFQIEFLVYRATIQTYINNKTNININNNNSYISSNNNNENNPRHAFSTKATPQPFSLTFLNICKKCSLKLFHLSTVVKTN